MDAALAPRSLGELGSHEAGPAGSLSASVHVTESPRLIWARVAGRLCTSEVDRVCEALDGWAARGPLVLDLRGVAEIDGAGIGLVLLLQAVARRTGGELVVLAGGAALEALRPLARRGRLRLIDLVDAAGLLLDAGA